MYAILDLIYIFLAVKGKMEELKLVSNHFIIWEDQVLQINIKDSKIYLLTWLKFMKEMKIW